MFSSTFLSARIFLTKGLRTHPDLSRLVLFDFFRVPDFLVCAAGLQIRIILQRQLDHDVVVPKFEVLLVSADLDPSETDIPQCPSLSSIPG